MVKRALNYLTRFDKNLWTLSLGWFVSAVGFAATIPFISIYFNEQFGMSVREIGYFWGGLAVVRSFFQVLAGEVSDRIERRQLLIYSQIARSFAFVAMGVGISFDLGLWWLAGALLLNSVFGSVFQPVANAMVADILPVSERVDGYAITRAARNLGWAAGPAIGGFMAHQSYSSLFYVAAVLTFGSAMIFLFVLTSPKVVKALDRFRFRDLLSIKDDKRLAVHSILTLALFLVVAQLIAPFSIYAVQQVGISESELGTLYALNGLMVVVLQIPVTRLLSRFRFTTLLSFGSIFYFIGYSMVGSFVGFWPFLLGIAVVTLGEIIVSPPSMTLTSRLAPPERMGRYMGIYSFFLSAGWSLGPLYGGFFLDKYADNSPLAWMLISSLALVSMVGYSVLRKKLPIDIDSEQK